MLQPVDNIPEPYRSVFSFKHFNAMQTEILDDVLRGSDHLVVGAPTGCGKTVIFELAIIELLTHFERVGKNKLKQFKIIYVSPTKALCNEIFGLWHAKFGVFNLKILALTGDSVITDLSGIEPYHIVITTPEKFDSLTRTWKENLPLIRMIKLVLIDEIHLLGDRERGAVLEAIVSRIKSFEYPLFSSAPETVPSGNEFTDRKIRFVILSSIIPNLEDIAAWIGNPVKAFRIPDEKRPVKLQKIVLGYPAFSTQSAFQFDMSLNYKLSGLIKEHWSGKPVLIFCSTRQSVEIARNILQANLDLPIGENSRKTLQSIAQNFTDQNLKVSVAKGIAFHHAGLGAEDRRMVEDGFRSGRIPVLLSTSSLAIGVNLPAHLVIIKSTEMYMQGATEEISENSIIQMMGRAGRPQYDSTGLVIIMTNDKKKEKYENLVSGTIPVESNLHHRITDHFNSEVVLQTISSIESAMEWLRTTYLYVRVFKNPSQYGISTDLTKERIAKKLEDLCVRQINELHYCGLITMNVPTLTNIISAVPGRLMSRYYLHFDTMKIFQKVNGTESVGQIFEIIISCPEFYDHKLRVSDKKILNELNHSNTKEFLRFPIDGKISKISDKISCLIQATLGNMDITNASLQVESMKLLKTADRLVKCLTDCVKSSNSSMGNFKALLSCILIARSLEAKLWENSPYLSKQLRNIDDRSARLLCENGMRSIASILNANSADVERILNKSPPFGSQVIESAAVLPTYSMQLEVTSAKRARIKVAQTNTKYVHQTEYRNDISLLVGDASNNVLFANDNGHFSLSEYGSFERTIRLRADSKYLYAYLIHQRLVGSDRKAEIGISAGSSVSSLLWPPLSIQTTSTVARNPKAAQKSKPPSTQANQRETENTRTITSYFPPLPTNGPAAPIRQQSAANRPTNVSAVDVTRVANPTNTDQRNSNGGRVIARGPESMPIAKNTIESIAKNLVEPIEQRLSQFSAPAKPILAHDEQQQQHSVYDDDSDVESVFGSQRSRYFDNCSQQSEHSEQHSPAAGPSNTQSLHQKLNKTRDDDRNLLHNKQAEDNSVKPAENIYDTDPFGFDGDLRTLLRCEEVPAAAKSSYCSQNGISEKIGTLGNDKKVAGFATAKAIFNPPNGNSDHRPNKTFKYQSSSLAKAQPANTGFLSELDFVSMPPPAPSAPRTNRFHASRVHGRVNEAPPRAREPNTQQNCHLHQFTNRARDTTEEVGYSQSDTGLPSTASQIQHLSLGSFRTARPQYSGMEAIIPGLKNGSNANVIEDIEEEIPEAPPFTCSDPEINEVIRESYSRPRHRVNGSLRATSMQHNPRMAYPPQSTYAQQHDPNIIDPFMDERPESTYSHDFRTTLQNLPRQTSPNHNHPGIPARPMRPLTHYSRSESSYNPRVNENLTQNSAMANEQRLPLTMRSFLNDVNNNNPVKKLRQVGIKNTPLNLFRMRRDFMENDPKARDASATKKAPEPDIRAMVAKGMELAKSGNAPASYYRDPYFEEIRKRHALESAKRSSVVAANGRAGISTNTFEIPASPKIAPKVAKKSSDERNPVFSSVDPGQRNSGQRSNPKMENRKSWPHFY